MGKMKAAVVAKAGADFELVEREIPAPGAGQVRIRVKACGICYSDHYTKTVYGRASPIRVCRGMRWLA